MERERRFTRLIGAVLFLAVCAYVGARLWSSLDDEFETTSVHAVSVTDSTALEGIAIRREQSFCPAGEPAFADGSRVAAGSDNAVSCSALYYHSCDGLERLSPALLPGLDTEGLSSIMSAAPASSDLARLVLGFEWYYAAFVDADAPVPGSGQCRVLFDGFDTPADACILSLSKADGGRKALVLRLTEGGDRYMSLRKCSAQLIFSEHTGLRLPVDSVHRDENGNKFVYTVTAGVVERKAVDIIYTDGDLCLAALSGAADALRDGNLVIVSGEELYEGKVTA